jgi:hypothetical protein
VADLITLIGIFIAGGVAVFGYLHTSRATRRERMAQSLAQAINAVGDYQDLPYRVRRRSSSDPAVRSNLAERISEIHSRLDFHSAWLRITAPEVATAYDQLVADVRSEAGAYIKEAWLQPIIRHDQEMNLGLGQQYKCPETDKARGECIEVMRIYLRSS